MENKDNVEEVKEEVCKCKEGEKCTCGEECHCGDKCNCGKSCKCGDDCKCKKSKKKIIFIIIGALLLIGLILCIYFFVIKGDDKDDDKKDNVTEEKEELTIDSEKVKELFITFSEINEAEYDSKTHTLDGFYDINRGRDLTDENERKTIIWEVLARNNKVTEKKCSELEEDIIDETFFCLGYGLSDLPYDDEGIDYNKLREQNKDAKTYVIDTKLYKEKYLELFGQDVEFKEESFELYNYPYGYAYYDKTNNVYAVFVGISGGEAIGGTQTLDKIEVKDNNLKLYTTLVLDESYNYSIIYTFKLEEKTGNYIFVSKEKQGNDNTLDEEYDDDSYDEEDAEVVEIYGVSGKFETGVTIKAYEPDEFGSLSFSYDLDNDSVLETFSINWIENDNFEENYQIKYTDKDSNGQDKVYSPVIKNVYGGLTGVDIVDINENDGKLDVLIRFYLDVSGEVVLFNVTTGETFSFGNVNNTNVYMDGNGKMILPIYYTAFFDSLFATEYYELGTDGKVTKNKIDLTNINKEVTFEKDCYYYCTSSGECDYDERNAFSIDEKAKLISYSEEDGFIAEYKGQKVYIRAPWG